MLTKAPLLSRAASPFNVYARDAKVVQKWYKSEQPKILSVDGVVDGGDIVRVVGVDVDALLQ